MSTITDEYGTWEVKDNVRLLIAPSAAFETMRAKVKPPVLEKSAKSVLISKGLASEADFKGD